MSLNGKAAIVNYRVLVKRLIDGQYHVGCNAAPHGVAEAFADTREAGVRVYPTG